MPPSRSWNNIIILLDLSDRIQKEGQIEKDKAIVKATLDLFQETQKRSAYLASKDILRLMIAKEPGVEVQTDNNLRINMDVHEQSQGSGNIGMPWFKKAKEHFSSSLDRVYSEAVNNPNTGADIYSFFCTEFPAKYLIDSMKNKVIVLTDGYLLFDQPYLTKRPECTYMRRMDRLREVKDNWKQYFESRKLSLCPCERSLGNVEVLLLETAPKFKGSSVYEFDIVEHYWKDWLGAMSQEVTVFPEEDKIEDIKAKVDEFLKEN